MELIYNHLTSAVEQNYYEHLKTVTL